MISGRILTAGSVLLLPLIMLRGPVNAETPPPASSIIVRQDMDAVFSAFRDLQKFMVNKNMFFSPANEQHIKNLLSIMSHRFHKVEAISPRFTNEPGFVSTVKIINEMLDDVASRFNEGKKDYALWRLKASYNYCISCHTRYEVSMEFRPAEEDLETLNSYEQGEFFLATRQFEKASESFLKSVFDPKLSSSRMDALRNWLVIYSRAHPDPQQAIIELNRIRSRAKLSTYEDEEIMAWLASLRRWQNESRVEVDDLRKAEILIAQGVAMNESLAGIKGAVELLRGSAILHKLMDSDNPDRRLQRGRILYLLGLAYSNLPTFFINELPEIFLEQCIRDYPGSDEAKRSYNLYKDILSLGYTGSGGTRLPDDVVANLKELHGIAYRAKTPVSGGEKK